MSASPLKAAAVAFCLGAVCLGAVLVPAARASLEPISYPTLLHDDIDHHLHTVIDAARSRGFGLVIADRRGALATGSDSTFTVRLLRGVEYRFAARCGAGCGDVDLILRDASGRELRADRGTDDAPGFSFVPSRSGDYVVTVAMYRCDTSRCQVGAVVMARA